MAAVSTRCRSFLRSTFRIRLEVALSRKLVSRSYGNEEPASALPRHQIEEREVPRHLIDLIKSVFQKLKGLVLTEVSKRLFSCFFRCGFVSSCRFLPLLVLSGGSSCDALDVVGRSLNSDRDLRQPG
jgi:hypothetical protein